MKTNTEWVLYQYVGGRAVPLSKPFKTRRLAEMERDKYPKRERKRIAIGLVRG